MAGLIARHQLASNTNRLSVKVTTGVITGGSHPQSMARYLIECYGRETTRMKTNRGFSLIEIMVAIAIVSIALTFAVPDMIGWRTKQRFLAAANEVHDAIKVARTSAIKDNRTVVIQFEPANRRYTVFAAATDFNEDGDQNDPGEGQRTIRSGSFQNDITLATGGLPSDRLTFDGRGLATNVGTGITLTNATYGSRVVQVTVTGNSRVL
jgi:type IV fimbrial biogenesis protein FimT